MTDIPEKEPFSFISGDTVKWTKTLDDYPASDSWVLKYYLVKDGVQKVVTATASDDDHLITIDAVASADYTPGTYHYQARVTKAPDAYTVAEGAIEVKPDFAAQASGYDNRSHVKKTLDALEAVIFGKASKDQLSYSIAGRSISRLSPGELLEWRDTYRAEYNKELRRAGRLRSSKVQVRF